ncbi:MAG: globin family protein [Anaerolineae bacterium]
MESTSATPLRWGVDDSGGPAHLELTKWGSACLEEFGFDTWVHHYIPQPTVEEDIAQVQRIDAWCQQQGIQWLLNVEDANFTASHTDSLGREWYVQPDGRQYFQFPDDILAVLGKCRALRGLLYDEAEHMQNCRHAVNQINRPYFYNPDGCKLADAADELTEACREIVNHHRRYGIQLYTESVFPVMLPCFARAGMTAATKVLKEDWSPPYYAVALGAALEYGTELWMTPDLWGGVGKYHDYPGHSVDEYESALLMAYSLGADGIYTENLAYDHHKRGRGSLVLAGEDGYNVTAYGKVTRAFKQEYIPSHPRHYRWQDVRPRTAIVRQEDGCWGQLTSWLPDYLLGNPDWHSDDINEGWLRAFHLLSNGVLPTYALSWHNSILGRQRAYQVFCPLDGVVVFDHHVQPNLLRGLEVIFLTGIGISPETLAGVCEAVRLGTTCIGRPALLPDDIRQAASQSAVADGNGKWLASESFLGDDVREAVRAVLPKGDELTYRFGDTQAVLRPESGNPNRLEAELVYK